MEEISKGKSAVGKIAGFVAKIVFLVFVFGALLYIFPPLAPAMDKTAGAIGTLFGSKTEINVFSEFADVSGKAIDRVLYLVELAKDNIEGKYAQKREVSPVIFTCAAELPCDDNNITSCFGERINPISKKEEVHTGIDFALAEGSNIYAAWPGTVAETGTDEIYGNYIVIKHSPSLFTRYCHLSEIAVEEGARVGVKEKIGEAGSTGWATGSHLHFEVLANGNAVDPKICLNI